MSFLGDLNADDGSGRNTLERGAENLANTAKNVAVAALEKNIAKRGSENTANESVKRAGFALAAAGAAYILQKAMSKDTQDIPDPWTNEQPPVDLSKQNYIRTPEHAYNTFFKPSQAGDQNYIENHPINSSLFLVDFVFNQEVVAGLTGNPLNGLFKTAFPMSASFLLKDMDFPRAVFETTRINSYNRYKVRPKKVNYEPININFQDIYTPIITGESKRASITALMKEYLSYYTNDVVRKEFNLQNGLSSDREHFQFIKQIDIYLFWSNGAKRISLVNPFINSFNYSRLSYEDNEPLTVSTTIEYEYMELSEMEISASAFIRTADHLVSEVDNGFTPDFYASPSNLDQEALQPLDRSLLTDNQRRLGLDNPVAAMTLRLAETEGLRKFGGNITSPDPVTRAVSRGLYTTTMDATGAATNAVSGAVTGLF